MKRFEGKSVFVTGGATGIGFATALRFMEEGAAVAIMGRRADALEKAIAELRARAPGGRAMFVQGDVSKEEDVVRCIGSVVDAFGGVDVLVNNAAMSTSVDFVQAETSEWKPVFDVIAFGTYCCTRTVARHMIERGFGGAIVNVSSINAYRALPLSSHYNAAKGATDQLTRCTAVELASHGIRVNAVNPGFVDTPMSIVDGENELDTEWFKDIYVERRKIPQARAGGPEEIASVVAFLASEDASYICGATIPVDGGLSVTF
ncbi:SDR family oxidoreductase [Paenibacillus antri]|uniref:SDR family oxidoreductase n=1 Tax=Paenibacillus antri TaxID=2582848 RepID=A0A5R9GLK0_9BACL|nr:SDR family oxidoreductase [Paenibacillus antri]TLS54003.1 SDR family oxidoreductase [Paenibacillus antri]